MLERLSIKTVKFFGKEQAYALAEFLNKSRLDNVEFRVMPAGVFENVEKEGHYIVVGYDNKEMIAFVNEYDGVIF